MEGDSPENWSKYFYYDETSPSCLRWKINVYSGCTRSRLNVAAGDVAGSCSEYYFKVSITIDGKRKIHKVHRIVYELLKDVKLLSNQQIDHINGNHKDNRIDNLRIVSMKINQKNRPKQKNCSTGFTGVNRSDVNGYVYYRAQWRDIDGNRQSKNFSAMKYGDAEAFRLACQCREAAIRQLNAQGAGYTERHGK